jgi:dienelactone hydrolase
VFPVWDAAFFEDPPTELGPFAVNEYRVEPVQDVDGSTSGITVFAPDPPEGPLPAMVWVMGSNVQAYYHQSLHETLASWGYVIIIPDTIPLTFTDFEYHRRLLDRAGQAIDLGTNGGLGVEIDPDRLAIGGYSIGGTLAALAAAENPSADAIVMWAPTGSPFWTGVTPEDLYPRVTQPALYVLAQLDHVAPPDGFPAQLQERMVQSEAEVLVIPNGLHLFFQQPTGADRPEDQASEFTRFEQQQIAIEATRAWLDRTFGINRNDS